MGNLPDDNLWRPNQEFHVWCSKHNCDLEENEHYDYWFLCADLSGFYCPNAGEDEQCDEYWKISPIGNDDVNILDLALGG